MISRKWESTPPAAASPEDSPKTGKADISFRRQVKGSASKRADSLWLYLLGKKLAIRVMGPSSGSPKDNHDEGTGEKWTGSRGSPLKGFGTQADGSLASSSVFETTVSRTRGHDSALDSTPAPGSIDPQRKFRGPSGPYQKHSSHGLSMMSALLSMVVAAALTYALLGQGGSAFTRSLPSSRKAVIKPSKISINESSDDSSSNFNTLSTPVNNSSHPGIASVIPYSAIKTAAGKEDDGIEIVDWSDDTKAASKSKNPPAKQTLLESIDSMQTLLPSDTVPKITGSKVIPGPATVAFRQRWSCLTGTNASEWRFDPVPRVLPWPREPLFRCGTKKGWLGRKSNALVKAGKYSTDSWPAADSLKYVWTPKTREVCGKHRPPSFRLFNSTEFCRSLQRTKGNMFIVGDSISWHFFKSLLDQLETYGAFLSREKPTEKCAAIIDQANRTSGHRLKRLPCESYLACGPKLGEGGVSITYVESMFLRRVRDKAGLQHSLFPMIDNIPELAWGDEMQAMNASIVVLNRGAHFIREEYFLKQLSYTFQAVRSLLPKALLVFRSTAAGHPNCNAYTKPITEPMKVDKWPFSWDKFGRENKLAQGIVEAVGGAYLDVNPMSTLRPDWHVGGKDCLHYCLPGLTDDWVKVFSKMLHDLT